MNNNSPRSIESLNAIIEIALYFCIRLKNEKLDKNNRFLFKAVVIEAINKIQENSFINNFHLSNPINSDIGIFGEMEIGIYM